MLDEDAEFLAELLPKMQVCFPLTPLAVIRHEPDNRFIECALAVRAHYLITANTAPGHFDQRQYGPAKVFTPGAFVNAAAVQPLIARLASE